jgi:hypothetical protein
MTFTIVTSPPVTSAAYAGKMNGKPGGRGSSMGGGNTSYTKPLPRKTNSNSKQ